MNDKSTTAVPAPIETSLQTIEKSTAEIRAYFDTPIECALSPWVLDSATPRAPDP